MSISLVSVFVRHERRIRLLFSNTLAAGAFATAPYTITCTNARGVDPAVAAAMQVASQPTLVELALASDLVSGGIYAVACAAVPAADASTFTGTEPFQFGTSGAPAANVEPAQRDAEELLYGIDCVWAGDFVETADGDLAVVSGLENVQGAIQRRMKASGLPWAPGYGPALDEYVDGPAPTAGTARGAIVRDLRKDDRVASVEAIVRTDEDAPNEVTLDVDVKLIGDRKPAPFTHTVTT